MSAPTYAQKLGAEFLGTAFLLSAIVGSGIMADSTADNKEALKLLCNSTAVGAALVVLILMFGPISGAHFNPAVTGAFVMRGDMSFRDAGGYVAVQFAGAVFGVVVTQAMFEQPLIELGTKLRSGPHMWLSEFVATFGLVSVIVLVLRTKTNAVPMAVGLYVASAIWFTSSTCFANPAVAIGRAMTDTWTGIRLADVPGFIISECAGAALAVMVCHALTRESEPQTRHAVTK